MLVTLDEYSDISPSQYEEAIHWLRTSGALVEKDEPLPPSRRIFRAALRTNPSPWFADAPTLIRDPDELPQDALRAAEAVGLKEDEAFSEIMHVWGKVDTSARERVGLAGETALVQILRNETTAEVHHLALLSDGYGYDIEVRAGVIDLHLEAKATTRQNNIVVYLSRNEFETMQRDSLWRLVVVVLGSDLEPTCISTSPREWVVRHVPSDVSRHGRWESCRIEMPSSVLVPGIPELAPAFRPDRCGLLAGSR